MCLAFLHETQERMGRVTAVLEPTEQHGIAIPKESEIRESPALAGREEAVAVDPRTVDIVPGKVA